MSKCPICLKEITILNKPGFGKGKILNGEIICSNCFLKLKEIDELVIANLESQNSTDLKLIIESDNPNLSRVNAQIAALNLDPDYLLFEKREIAELPKLLMKDENIKSLVVGNYNDEMGTGILVLTDMRILFVRKSIFYGLKIEDFSLDKISVIQYVTSFNTAIIKITVAGIIINIKFAKKKFAKIFCEKVRSEISEPILNSEIKVQNTNEIINQLEKLASLKNKGILTEEEFNIQKQKLLNP